MVMQREIEAGYTVTDGRHRPQVVADNHQRQPELLFYIQQKINEPLLSGSVYAGCWFIQQEQLSARSQCPRDQQTLKLSAGECC